MFRGDVVFAFSPPEDESMQLRWYGITAGSGCSETSNDPIRRGFGAGVASVSCTVPIHGSSERAVEALEKLHQELGQVEETGIDLCDIHLRTKLVHILGFSELSIDCCYCMSWLTDDSSEQRHYGPQTS